MNLQRLIVTAIYLTAGFGVSPQGWTQAPPDLPASTRLSLPGDKHRWLEPLAGKWAVEMRVWPMAGAQPIVSKEMVASREWILGGRYLREELSGQFAGNPSSRIGILSFNNLEERFEFSTIDSFEPGQMWYASRSVGTSKLISMSGENTEAGFGAKPTGRKRDLRLDIEIAKGSNTQRIFVKYAGEPEFLFVEQRFTPLP